MLHVQEQLSGSKLSLNFRRAFADGVTRREKTQKRDKTTLRFKRFRCAGDDCAMFRALFIGGRDSETFAKQF